jgi:hypothetical protein
MFVEMKLDFFCEERGISVKSGGFQGLVVDGRNIHIAMESLKR